jgi:hypothetical protein
MSAVEEHGHEAGDEGPEPRIRTLVAFGAVMMVVIVGIIVVAALIGR